jgi:hypothetical protein
MKERIVDGVIEVVKMSIKSKLSSWVKSGLKRRVQFTDCEITSDGDIDNPKITMIQKFVNMSELPLKLSKVEL